MLDGRFFGQRGGAYPVALESATVGKKLKPRTVAGAMCCYGAQVFSPDDPAVAPAGASPVAIAYLRRGALGFAGATEIAWVGVDRMACADAIVTRYLGSVRAGASQGRALLEAKQAYLRALQQAGREPGIEDEKTLLEFVLLGDPSIHPVVSAVAPAPVPSAGTARRAPAAAAARPSPAAAGERQRRRVFAAQLAVQLRAALPTRKAAAAAPRKRAPRLFRIVEEALGKAAKAMGFSATPLRVDRVEPARLPAVPAVAALRRRAPGGAPAARQATLQYYWTGKRVVDGHAEIRLVRVETDTAGKVLRQAVVRSG
jgi:hypothetical protein